MARSRLLRALLLAGLALAWATPAPIVAFNNEAQAAVRELGIPSQIASRVRRNLAAAAAAATAAAGAARWQRAAGLTSALAAQPTQRSPCC